MRGELGDMRTIDDRLERRRDDGRTIQRNALGFVLGGLRHDWGPVGSRSILVRALYDIAIKASRTDACVGSLSLTLML
jgi:hypothetical protein